MGGLNIQPAIGFNCPPAGCESFPLLHLDETVSDEGIIDGEPFAVTTLAMDLSSMPERARQSGWKDSVRLVTSVSGRNGPPPAEADPNGIYGFESVELESQAEGTGPAIIAFQKVDDFPDLQAAVDYIRTEQYQQIQDVMRSFSARACTGGPAEPRSYTGPNNNSVPDLCAAEEVSPEL
ncbi:hypothetical protein ASH00_15560 [Arthrobacter sp. Soil782]|uniref:hypothetical protein n=1 Tax=Arthrobacter sp. Soil782 TaxID=1736410 RepID=UPI0006F9ECC1|nr:hypothetical protein [Arthrobacter sp. Soil782]KRF03436.1 hypothetical protein ASH00_15560 [Arthrobacter sp. Soil782]